jgi:hypothetical protein
LEVGRHMIEHNFGVTIGAVEFKDLFELDHVSMLQLLRPPQREPWSMSFGAVPIVTGGQS